MTRGSAASTIARKPKPKEGVKEDKQKKGPFDWAGQAPLGTPVTVKEVQKFEHRGDKLKIVSEYSFAQQANSEALTSAVLNVRRFMHFTLEYGSAKHGQRVTLTVNGRARLHAMRMPNDIRMALKAPAVLANHDGMIRVLKTGQAMTRSGKQHTKGGSLYDLVQGDSLIAYDTPASERIRAMYAALHIVDVSHRNDKAVAGLEKEVAALIAHLDRYMKKKLSYHDADPKVLAMAEESLRRLLDYQARLTGKEGLATEQKLDELYRRLRKKYTKAKKAKPKDKDLLDHAADLATSPINATVSAAKGVAELGLMLGDVARYAGAETYEAVTGDEVKWKAWSAVGKMRQAGKGWDEIAVAAVDGFINQVKDAYERAKNGDYSGLFDLSAEFAADVGLGLLTGGSVPGAKWSAKAAKLAKGVSAKAKALGKKADVLAGKLAKAGKAPRWAVDELRAVGRGLGEAFGKVKATTAGAVAIDGIPSWADIKGAYQRHRLDVARAETLATLKKRGVPGARKGKRSKGAVDAQHLLLRLEAIGEKFPEAAGDMVTVMRQMETVKNASGYMRAIDGLLNKTGKIQADDLAKLLRHSTRLVDPIKFLDDVKWLADHGLSSKARRTLFKKIVEGKAPDLAWLRKTKLTQKQLDFLAADSGTSWKSFMKVSKEPSDMFPAKRSKRGLKEGAYKDANRKIRGAAAEMVVNEMKLPGDLKIRGRQIDIEGKKLDFEVLDSTGSTAHLEVKAGGQAHWNEGLAAAGKGRTTDAMQRLLDQLNAAKGTGQPVYLAVSDVLNARTQHNIRKFLGDRGLGTVKIISFSEAELQKASRALRKAMHTP